MPSVSIIIPTYNRAHMLLKAIQSVLNQTYQDFEVIMVDDGSTNNTEEVVRNLRDERIQYFQHEKNRGVAVSRNTGIQVANSKYIAFLDSDDEWFPTKLEKQVNRFKESKAVLISHHVRLALNEKDYEREKKGFKPLKKENSYSCVICLFARHQPNLLLKFNKYQA
jgi:glycosyltransferase involved in cell wall biosynthesis